MFTFVKGTMVSFLLWSHAGLLSDFFSKLFAVKYCLEFLFEVRIFQPCFSLTLTKNLSKLSPIFP